MTGPDFGYRARRLAVRWSAEEMAALAGVGLVELVALERGLAGPRWAELEGALRAAEVDRLDRQVPNC